VAVPTTLETQPTRRSELAGFLRARRERLSPQEVGLPPGPRRRTPGLRREELALLAGVGVTWYTWLEQGRPINASVQVLDAVARTLRLDQAEREHLYRLAEATPVHAVTGAEPPSPAVVDIAHGGSANVTVDVQRMIDGPGGFTITGKSYVPGIKAAKASGQFAADGSGSATVAITVTQSVPNGYYPLVLTTRVGDSSRTFKLLVTVDRD